MSHWTKSSWTLTTYPSLTGETALVGFGILLTSHSSSRLPHSWSSKCSLTSIAKATTESIFVRTVSATHVNSMHHPLAPRLGTPPAPRTITVTVQTTCSFMHPSKSPFDRSTFPTHHQNMHGKLHQTHAVEQTSYLEDIAWQFTCLV